MKHSKPLKTLWLTAILLLLNSVPLTANAYDFMVEGIAYDKNSDGTSVTVTTYGNYIGEIFIPESVAYYNNIYSVTSIGDYAFSHCSGLTSVVIPNSVTSIGSYAFNGCSGLISIAMPNSVTSIGESAFYECSGLTSVTIPNSVTSIGYRMFSHCVGLTSVNIPNSVTSIGYEAFQFCSGLPNVTIPNSVTSIGSYAFNGCSGLTSVTIPNSVTSIDTGAFSDCSGLTSVTIGNSVIIIGGGAFKNCSLLENLYSLRERPIFINASVFEGVPKASCDLHVINGAKVRYEAQDVWKDFLFIIEDAESGDNENGIKGDVNGDGKVNVSDVTALINIILGIQ